MGHFVAVQMKISLRPATNFRALGVGFGDEKVTLYYYSPEFPKDISSAVSPDGIEFEKANSPFIILDENKKQVDPAKLIGFKISTLPDSYSLKYQKIEKGNLETYTATSKFQGTWETTGKPPEDTDLNVDFSVDTDQGRFILYHTDSSVKVKYVDPNNPSKIIWESKNSLWVRPQIWDGLSASCLGAGYYQGKFLSYWDVDSLGVFVIAYPTFENQIAHEENHFKLTKHPSNPVLSPLSHNEWESEATFNPAAFYADGKVYLIYRAVGHNYISVLGYAESSDGTNFAKRLSEPIYTASEPFELQHPNFTKDDAKKYISGGGYGGCEDPRITKIGDRLYLVYVAFNGWEPPRLAMTSILYENFINHRFLWEKPVLISPSGVVDKSGCILPEKINDKYVIFHRIYPNILIDFVDDLKFDGTHFLQGQFTIGPRPGMWDSRKVGVGAPPIKTDDGWLLIYQAVGEEDSSKYKVGAMLLDLQNPTKVLYRTNHPIIEPTENYENGLAKFGVVYPCGAVIVNGQLMVYYGGSDSVTCVASANLKEFIREIKNGGNVLLKEVNLI